MTDPRPAVRNLAATFRLPLVAVALSGACEISGLAGVASAQTPDFVNFESPQTHGLARTDDGRLLAVNTADGRLEVLDIAGARPMPLASVRVGVDPVSVRVRANGEIWVVNQISDSISVLDPDTLQVVRTILVGDEPGDVVFAGSPERAFVTLGPSHSVVVFDPDANAPATQIIEIAGAMPRALAVSPDGATVHVAIFESGNATTLIPRTVVSSPASPYGGQNPPPNAGNQFDPPRAPGLPASPTVGQIVRRDAQGRWMDDNGRDWSSFVSWDVVDHDVASIDANSLAVSYAGGVMSTVTGLDVDATGAVFAVGLEATNEVRFEENLNGTFIRVLGATFDTGGPTAFDLNPHLDYTQHTISAEERTWSVGDPRGVVCLPDGGVLVANLGSNSLLRLNAANDRVWTTTVGEGPTSIALDATGTRAFVLNRFDGSISTVDLTTGIETDRRRLFDPTPSAIKDGRPFLYDTHLTSGLGQASCASCHIDGRTDRLAWDLGNPAGAVIPFDGDCQVPNGPPGAPTCINWHPMKGPLVSQTLLGTIGNEPFHWRGEKRDLADFNVAFTDLQGRPTEISATEMIALENYVSSLVFPPNPNRNLDDTLRNAVSIVGGGPVGPGGTGNALNGRNLFLNAGLFPGPPGAPPLTCVSCHADPIGSNNLVDIPAPGGTPQNRKNAHLRELYRKVGANKASQTALRGFGFDHNGEESTMQDLLSIGFVFAPGATGLQQRRDIEAYMYSFQTGTHAGTGAQVTVGDDPVDVARFEQFRSIANGTAALDLVATILTDGREEGWLVQGTTATGDRDGVSMPVADLLAMAAPDRPITATLVPGGSGARVALDRDRDGFRDGDEFDAGTDPTDPDDYPGACPEDIAPFSNPDGIVNGTDLGVLMALWGEPGVTDLNGDGTTNSADLGLMLAAWGVCE